MESLSRLPSQRERFTKTWLQSSHPSSRVSEIKDIISEYCTELAQEARLVNEDGEFDFLIDVPADLKREVYVVKNERLIVIDDQLVYDVSNIALQMLIYPNPTSLLTHFVLNCCEYLVALGGASAGIALANHYIANYLDCIECDLSRIFPLYGQAVSVEDQIRDGARLVLISHEMGHLLGGKDEIGCDLLGVDLLDVLHEKYTRTRLGFDQFGHHQEPVFDEGLPHVIAFYNVIIGSILISLELYTMLRRVRGGVYNKEEQQKRFDFVFERIEKSISELDDIFGDKYKCKFGKRSPREYYQILYTGRQIGDSDIYCIFRDITQLVEQMVRSSSEQDLLIWNKIESMSSYDINEATEKTKKIVLNGLKKVELESYPSIINIFTTSDKKHPDYKYLVQIEQYVDYKDVSDLEYFPRPRQAGPMLPGSERFNRILNNSK